VKIVPRMFAGIEEMSVVSTVVTILDSQLKQFLNSQSL
jgi:hypothetical protein